MSQIMITSLSLSLAFNAVGQADGKNLFQQFYASHLKSTSEQKELQFFALNGYGGRIGLEFSRFQTEFIYIKAELTLAIRDVFFNK